MKIINLLPKEELRQLRLEVMSGQILSFWIWVLISIGFIFSLSLVGSLYLSQRISINNAEIENRKQVLKSSATQELEQQVSSLNKQVGLIESLRREHYYWSEAFIELTYLVDTNTTLTSVSMDRETGKVTVSGTATDRDGVLAFWAAVKKSKYFTDVDFPLKNLEKDQGAVFTFNFKLNPEAIKKP